MNGLKNKTSLIVVYFFSFIYFEFLYRIMILGIGKTFRLSNVNMLIFLLGLSVVCYLLSKLLPEKANKWIFYILMLITSVWFAAQFVVKDVFDFYISTQIFKEAGQLTESVFLKETFIAILARIPQILLFFIPFILSLIFKKHLSFRRMKFAKFIMVGCFAALVFIGNYYALNIGKKEIYSAYNLYHNINNPTLSIESTGVLNTFFVDLRKEVFGFEEKIVIVDKHKKKKEEPKEKVYEYNNLNIDFEALKANTKDSQVIQMTEYFQNEEGTKQNEYTGFFKNKNLIVFMAESFNEIAVDEELTPTLYKMIHNGFEFNNFYSPTIYSTIGGEMQELTSLYPTSYGKFKEGTTSFPMGMGNIFRDAGYNTFAYHDHTYSFQNRYLYLKNLGFDNFKACGNGLQSLVTTCYGVGSKSQWPESDVEMMETTPTEWINSTKPFAVFYATVSGHGSYTPTGAISKKYYDLVDAKFPSYSAEIKAYIAAQIELDRALETLLKTLEDAGKLDDTVIALVGDHYPYMLSIDLINEAASYQKDEIIEVNHSNFILYNSAMKKVSVDKVGSQIDVMPTLYNLFGLKYDSRLLIGKDILATNEGLAMFGSRSWASDKGKYWASSHKFVPNEGVEFATPEEQKEYVDTQNQIVSGKITMSGYIMNKNYYATAWQYLKETKIEPKTVENNQTIEEKDE